MTQYFAPFPRANVRFSAGMTRMSCLNLLWFLTDSLRACLLNALVDGRASLLLELQKACPCLLCIFPDSAPTSGSFRGFVFQPVVLHNTFQEAQFKYKAFADSPHSEHVQMLS